jgi:hypothetical protein
MRILRLEGMFGHIIWIVMGIAIIIYSMAKIEEGFNR